MAVKITYFVHGTTFDNEQGIASGWKDVDISETGVNQSILLKETLQDKKFDIVFCSDLKRAVHSANLTFFGTVPIIEDERLRECNCGDFNGAPLSTFAPLQENFIEKAFPNGESYEDVKTRIADFLEFLKKNYDGKNVAIVAHEAPQLALEVLLRSKTWKQAFDENWRKTHAWKPGWSYIVP